MNEWRCECGALNERRKFCEMCGASQPGRVLTPAKPDKACSRCGETFQFWTSLTHGEDGQRRCGTCHVEYLKARAEAGRVCTEPGCATTADEHRAEFLAISEGLVKKMTTMQESWRTTPSLLERLNHHALRPSVKRALGIAENAPDPTPAEWAELERKKAEARRKLEGLR